MTKIHCKKFSRANNIEEENNLHGYIKEDF